jgi:hypothetical protein
VTTSCTVLLVVPDHWMQIHADDGESTPSVRTTEQADRLAEELMRDGAVTARIVPISELSRDPAGPRESTLFLTYDVEAPRAIAAELGRPLDAVERRTFFLAARRRAEVIAALERSGGPGCIESARLFTWQTELPEDDPPGGVFGRKDIARSMGAHWEEPALWESEHYAMLFHDSYATLPRLLAAYLSAFCAASPPAALS